MLTCQPQVVGHDDSRVPWPSTLPGTSCCPYHGWCRVARMQTLFILHWCWAFVAARYRCAHECTPGDTWCSLPLLTVRSRIINLDETWASSGRSGPEPTTAPTTLPASARASQACASHGMDTRRAAGDRHDAPQHSSLVRHRLHRCQAGRCPRLCHTAPHRRHGLQASPPSCGAGAPHHRGIGPTRARRLSESEHEAPEPEDAHEEAPIPVLNRFFALRIVYGDGLRRIPTASAI